MKHLIAWPVIAALLCGSGICALWAWMLKRSYGLDGLEVDTLASDEELSWW